MRHKVGDKVIVKSLDWYNANKNAYGHVINLGSYFVKDMSKLCGKLVTINAITKHGYQISEDEYNYLWRDFMFEEDVTNEVKIEVPEGYEIDKENSTFECIKFKKKSEVKIYTTSVGVRVDTPECSFYILDKEDLPIEGYSSFKLAKLYHKDATLPSKKQWEIIYKYLDEINELLNYKIKRVCYWALDLGESPTDQWYVTMYSGTSYIYSRYGTNGVRPIINNITWKNS